MNEIKKKLIRNMLIIVGIFVLVAIILLIAQGCSNKKMSYSKIEEKLVSASKKYLKKVDLLPKIESGISVVGSEVLISNGYLKSFEKMTDSKNCLGKVYVQKNGEYYDYIPYLKCDDYETNTLFKAITSNVVKEDDGVYYQNNEYVYRGKKVNNYIKFSDRLWRIIKITEDGYLKLISVDSEKRSLIWDNKYNVDVNKYNGINDFEKSEIKDSLLAIYNNKDVIKENAKNKLVARNLCIGKRNMKNYSFENVECSEKTKEKYFIDLPTTIDLSSASIDKNCKDLKNKACTNFNYFYDFFDEGWSLIGVKEDTSSVYLAHVAGLYDELARTKQKINLVIYLNANVVLKSGNGTEKNPYKI